MLVKLRMKASVKSSQLLMLRGLRLLQHEGHVLHGNAPVAVGYANRHGIVDQPIFRLHGAVVLGRVSWEREPFGKGLVADAGAETRRADIIFFF